MRQDRRDVFGLLAHYREPLLSQLLLRVLAYEPRDSPAPFLQNHQWFHLVSKLLVVAQA
jgi:hypothetical protein